VKLFLKVPTFGEAFLKVPTFGEAFLKGSEVVGTQAFPIARRTLRLLTYIQNRGCVSKSKARRISGTDINNSN